jgi:outer membrane lipoprotein-sorting protein
MRKRNLAATLLMLVAPALLGQTADELVTKYIQARGGMEKIKTIQSMRMTGTMTTGQLDVPIVMLMKRPNLVRMEFEVQGVTGVRAYDGENGWALMPFLGTPDATPITGQELKEFGDQSDIDGGLVDYKAKGSTVELVGKEKVDGADAYKLKVTRKNGDVDTVFLDAVTYLQIREEGQRTVQGSLKDFETKIGDYRDVEGLKFPYAIVSGVKGDTQHQNLTIQKVELNVPADASLFKMPRAGATPPGPSSGPAR